MDELIPAIQGSLADIKRMRDRCLDAGIAVAVMAPPGKGWGTKLVLLVREADLQAVGELLHSDWQALVEREGTGAGGLFGVEVAAGEEPPCPCCGTAAPLAQGACSECGLQLEW